MIAFLTISQLYRGHYV